MDFPITPLTRLGEDARGNALWMKRDDLLPYSFGGNKVRIAAELLEDMRAKGKNHMIAYGNPRSNLCRALSNLCAAQGVPCTVLSPADDDGSRSQSFNLLLSRAFHAEIVPCQKTDVPAAVDAAMEKSLRLGRKPYYLYGDRTGGGNLEAPVRAYRKVYAELLSQQREMGVRFDELFLATGTGMTQAGLICGQCCLGGDLRINGVSIARDRASGQAHIAAYLRAASCGADVPVHFTDAYALGYGVENEDILACIRSAMTLYGVPLDPTYTGKAFWGMQKELARRNVAGKQILFLHTGGTPLFFDRAPKIFQR